MSRNQKVMTLLPPMEKCPMDICCFYWPNLITVAFGRQKKWLLVVLDRWSSNTVTIVWEFAWADSALVVLDKWSSYRGGRLNREKFTMSIKWGTITVSFCKNKNRKFPSSNPTRCSAGLRDLTSLRDSLWPSGRKCKMQWLALGEWGCPPNNGPKLAVGQPNSS